MGNSEAVLPLFFFTDHIELPLPRGHRFPIRKYQKLREKLAGAGVFDFEPAPLASSADVERAHDPQYVHAFLNGELPAAALRRIGFPWSEGLVRRTLASVGGTLAASRTALERGWGGTLAGGLITHSGRRGQGSVFSTTLLSLS